MYCSISRVFSADNNLAFHVIDSTTSQRGGIQHYDKNIKDKCFKGTVPENVTWFPKNVTWFHKIYDKLYDKKVLGIPIGD